MKKYIPECEVYKIFTDKIYYILIMRSSFGNPEFIYKLCYIIIFHIIIINFIKYFIVINNFYLKIFKLYNSFKYILTIVFMEE